MILSKVASSCDCDDVPDELICTICQGAIIDAIRIDCPIKPHLFCDMCATRHIIQSENCPMCRAEVNLFTKIPNIIRHHEEKMCKCECGWTGSIASFRDDHRTRCKKSMMFYYCFTGNWHNTPRSEFDLALCLVEIAYKAMKSMDEYGLIMFAIEYVRLGEMEISQRVLKVFEIAKNTLMSKKSMSSKISIELDYNMNLC
jgi:hypothetical protein